MNPSLLQGKVVLVTGSARRVGSAIVRQLHQAGASVALHYRAATAEAEALAAELNAGRPGSAITLQADLLDISLLPVLVTNVLTHFGRLDGLVNNASSFFPTAIGQIDEMAWDDLVGSNFKAPLFLSQAAAPALRASGGAIVNITDIHAERPLQGYPLYSAAKGALLTLTRALAVELAPDVRVNAVAPGPILWPDDGQFDDPERVDIVRHTLLKREGAPEDIAGAVAYLLSAAYVTGQVINVDGGRTAYL
ncbi:MAG: pteridine reductase [Betaproteobacteria bacterium]|uniref:Pteridine reductase n=1 Tax=Candidatus Proximibacter danicus TaxID=2954365 RepID=A0A9D7PSD5_9PROT|nr:pteridine reductase [Candidatus Proximibacter danicus]MBK9447144.1 pteridine reductase [Betaproteobacteria bacterium]